MCISRHRNYIDITLCPRFRQRKRFLTLIVCITIICIVNLSKDLLTLEENSVYTSPGNIFVCVNYLSIPCPLAKEFAKLLFPNKNFTDYKGQNTSKEDILVTVCGCTHAYLFNGVILYGDNGNGNLYLPGVSQRKVIYAGVRFPTPSALVLERIEFFFPAFVAMVVSKTLRRNVFLRRHYRNKKRSFFIYHPYYCGDLETKIFEKFVQVSSQHGFDIPVETRNCAGSRSHILNTSDTSLYTIENDIRILSNFRFAIVMENKNVTGYITERIMHAFLAGTIPIYSGTKEVFKLFNANSFIYFDIENPQKAIDKVVHLEQNKEAYLNVIGSPILANGKRTLREYFSLIDDTGDGLLKRHIFHAIKRGQSKFLLDPLVKPNGLNHSKISILTNSFASKANFIPFYMYDSTDFYKGNWSLSLNCWKDKSADFALLKIFEAHPWRTKVASKAKVFIIPFSFSDSHKCDYRGHRKRVEKGMNTVVTSRSFKRYNGRDHLLMAHDWQMSVWSKGAGLLWDPWWDNISEVTATRYEYYGMSKWENSLSYENKRRVPKSMFHKQWEPTKRSLVVPYATRVELNVVTPDYSEWQKRPYFIWYHVKPSDFAYDATKLRRLPINKRYLFPGDIGFDISHRKWISGWSKSKFCFVVRGDTPTSHAFYNALASSCIPVVISDTFDIVGVAFKDLVSLESIAIRFPENQFLDAPETLVPFLKNVSEDYIKTKLFNIKIAQPILVIRHEKSILPELILYETSRIIDNIFNMH